MSERIYEISGARMTALQYWSSKLGLMRERHETDRQTLTFNLEQLRTCLVSELADVYQKVQTAQAYLLESKARLYSLENEVSCRMPGGYAYENENAANPKADGE